MRDSAVDAAAVDLSSANVAVLRRILKGALAARASDVHLRVNQPPLVRLEGELCALEHPDLGSELLEEVCHQLCLWGEVPRARHEHKQLEFSVGIPDIGRFRCHVYRQRGTRAAVLRHIPSPVPSFAQLRLPAVIKPICNSRRGLVAVTGATGNGKSTTIAAMLSFMNEQSCRHIVTLEDPIEFLFEDQRSSFSQREIGIDVDSFEDGLEGALREDPDVIFVGEIRDSKTFDVVLNAAESGHLVVTTMHSTNASSAINRMVGFYPPTEQASARERLADAVTAIVAQKLLPKKGSQSERVLVTEVLRRGGTISECIRDPARFRGLPSALDQNFHELGTHTMDHQLIAMVQNNVLAVETARAAARSPKDLVRHLKLNR